MTVQSTERARTLIARLRDLTSEFEPAELQSILDTSDTRPSSPERRAISALLQIRASVVSEALPKAAAKRGKRTDRPPSEFISKWSKTIREM